MEVSETEAAKEPGPTPQVCTLDLELMINRLLGYKDNPGKQVKPFTCLLYTSPSPRDATLSRMPSSA